MPEEKLIFWGGPGGALLCNKNLAGVNGLGEEDSKYYGGKYLIGETISISTQKLIAKAFNGEYKEKK